MMILEIDYTENLPNHNTYNTSEPLQLHHYIVHSLFGVINLNGKSVYLNEAYFGTLMFVPNKVYIIRYDRIFLYITKQGKMPMFYVRIIYKYTAITVKTVIFFSFLFCWERPRKSA